jgi:hypothetical protein
MQRGLVHIYVYHDFASAAINASFKHPVLVHTYIAMVLFLQFYATRLVFINQIAIEFCKPIIILVQK